MKAKLVLATATTLFLSMLAITAYSVESSKAVGVWLFNEGEGDVARDSSGNNHHGQILAGVKWTEGTSGSALRFPGNGEANYVKIPHEATLNLVEHSVTAWIKLSPTEIMPTENSWQLLLGKWQPHGVRNYSLMARKDTGVILAQFSSGGEKQYKNVIGNTKLADEEWHHIACTYDGNFLRLYVDAALEAEIEGSGPDQNPGDITIGAAFGGIYPTKGAIDDIGLFNIALAESDIRDIMTDGLWNSLGLAKVEEVAQVVERTVEDIVKNTVEETIKATVEKALSAAMNAQDNPSRGVEFSGKMEGEFGHVAAGSGYENDFALAKVELGADVALSSNVGGCFIFQYSQGEDVTVDEGSINFDFPVTSAIDGSVSFGFMCVPFGEFNSHFIADPFTKDIGETKQAALQFAVSNHVFEASAVLYNEEVDVVGDTNSQIGDVAARIAAFTPDGSLGGDAKLSVGTSFIGNMAGTDGLTDMLTDGSVLERPTGLGGFVSLSSNGVFVEGEIIRAMNDVLLPDGGVLKPIAFNVELGLSLPDMPVELAGRYEQLSENGGDPINRFGGVVSIGIFGDTASLAVEFLRTENGDEDENSISSQLAVGF